MDRATRDKFASGTQADLTSGNATWQTPPAIFEKLNTEYGPFDVDLCADAASALCSIWFGPGSPFGEDARSTQWLTHDRTRGFDNPPYGPFVQHVLDKAKREALRGFLSVHLLPLRVTKAFRAHVLHGARELLFCDKRITFWERGAPRVGFDQKGRMRYNPALFDSIIVVFGPGVSSSLRVAEWHVPVHVPLLPDRVPA